MKTTTLKHLGYLPAGDQGTEITVRKLIKLIEEGTKDPVIISTARRIVLASGAKNAFERAKAIYDYVKKNIAYVNDPRNLELIRPARKILEDRIGDCDEHVVLTASLLRAVGFPVALVTISTPQNPEAFSHIYSIVKVGKIWYPVDTIIKWAQFGYEYPNAVKKRIWPIDEAPSELQGIEGFIDYFKSLGKKVEEAVKKAYEEGKKTFQSQVYGEAEKYIQEQKQKIKSENDDTLIWTIMALLIIFLAVRR